MTSTMREGERLDEHDEGGGASSSLDGEQRMDSGNVATTDSNNTHSSSPSPPPPAIDVKKEKLRIMKNILLISLAFLFNFNAFQGLGRLQSTLNKVDNLGVITSSVIYGTLMISCMFLPKIVINFIGHRWTVALSFIGYILYMAANGYAVWGTMITASVLVGLCAAPLWTAQCSYFTIAGARYARISGENEDAVVSRFFGIFFCFFQISSITGSIISSTVLKPDFGNGTEIIELQFCGINDCPDNNVTNSNLEKPPSSTVWTMVGIYIGIACLAVVTVALFVDNLPKEDVEKKANVTKEILTNFVATFYHLRHKEMLIMIPITMYSGFEQAFYSAEFTKSFVACSLGIWKVGLVTLAYGIANAIMSYFGGHLAKYTGRVPIFVFGMCINLANQIVLMVWLPTPDKEYVLYILAAMWGIADGIWQTQINTVYGIFFSKESEAAFSNYRMWESLGFIIAFAYSGVLCTSVKLYIVTGMLLLGMAGYLVAEYWHKRKRNAEVLPEKERNSAEQKAAKKSIHYSEIKTNNPDNIKSRDDTPINGITTATNEKFSYDKPIELNDEKITNNNNNV